eukprot:7391490-Prymnesium_polylepis.3
MSGTNRPWDGHQLGWWIRDVELVSMLDAQRQARPQFTVCTRGVERSKLDGWPWHRQEEHTLCIWHCSIVPLCQSKHVLQSSGRMMRQPD